MRNESTAFNLRRLLAVATVLILIFPTYVLSWGKDGHKIVGHLVADEAPTAVGDFF